ncbi:hypothetical protein GGQ04_003167 [Salinibacter ruber]|nr:hypothetical protein [Salinibacter ruber]MCS4181869.1 hypothetical protein [Salinibacter ruber]
MLSGAYSMLLGAYIAIRSFGLSVLVPIGASLFASSSASADSQFEILNFGISIS